MLTHEAAARLTFSPEVALPQIRVTLRTARVGAAGFVVSRRSRRVTLADLYEALRLTSKRHGNGERRTLLLESRANPWSKAERTGHLLLRAEGLTGWTGNYPLPLLRAVYYLDLVFPAVKLAIEIDGRA